MADNNNTQHIVWHDDAIIKQLISYAVGCMLGRYRLDKPGLHIAHPNPTDEEIAPYEYKGEQWEIDDDGIMPLMPTTVASPTTPQPALPTSSVWHWATRSMWRT